MGLLKDGTMTAETNNRRTMFAQLAEVNRRLGDMAEAYRWSAAYSHLSDSLNNTRLKEKIAGLEARFQNAEDQKKITLLAAEKSRAELAARNGRLGNWLLGTVCILLGVTAVFSITVIRTQRKVQQLRLARAMLDGEERERKRIAQDLHDGLGGMLASAGRNSLLPAPSNSELASQRPACSTSGKSLFMAAAIGPGALVPFPTPGLFVWPGAIKSIRRDYRETKTGHRIRILNTF
jgi:signal transduction histidine kinase